MTITLQPAIAVKSGDKLLITLVGQSLSGLPTTPSTQVLVPASQNSNSIISSSRRMPNSASVIEITFGANMVASSLLSFTFGTFDLDNNVLPIMTSIEAAILDSSGDVVAASSQGNFPAIFASETSGSSVNLSSVVASAPNVTLSVSFSPLSEFTVLRLIGLHFVEFNRNSGQRRLLDTGVSCNNLGCSVISASYNAVDGEMHVTFQGPCTRIDPAVPCSCDFFGFRNPAAAVALSISVATYDSSGAGSTIQSNVLVPAILCPPGNLQSTSGSAVSCSPCAKGTYSDKPGLSQCLKCPMGTYSDTSGASSLNSCIRCPAATFNNISGAFDLAGCMSCPPGTSSSQAGASECAPCAAGTFSESRQEFCALCPAGSFGPQQRATSKDMCSGCSAGTFAKPGSAVCSRCSPGTTSEKGSEKCSVCPQGTYSQDGSECTKCSFIFHTIKSGSTSSNDCVAFLIDPNGASGRSLGVIIFFIYTLSFLCVPSWSATDDIVLFKLNANVDDAEDRKSKSKKKRRQKSWYERFRSRLKPGSDSSAPAAEKRFFETNDQLRWENHSSELNADNIIGTVQNTSVFYGQDATEKAYSEFNIFVKLDSNFKQTQLDMLTAAFESGTKPILIDPNFRTCRCQLESAPSINARLPLLGWPIGPWKKIRQLQTCFHLFILSIFPAFDSATDLVHLISSVYANIYLFAASILFLFIQVFFFCRRLYRRGVWAAVKKRKVEFDFVRDLRFWPKWAQSDSGFVMVLLNLPFWIFYHIVFPVIWFLLGFALHSFQLFPISRISNLWLYAMVYRFVDEEDSVRKRFDTSDGIMMSMLQKGVVQEAIFESVPQLVIQLYNTYLLGTFSNITLLSVSVSSLSVANTVYFYLYWLVYRLKRSVREIPCALALYNYKITGVQDGKLSFSKRYESVKEEVVIEMESQTVYGQTVSDTHQNPTALNDVVLDAEMPSRNREQVVVV